jgi:hypothetical protein
MGQNMVVVNAAADGPKHVLYTFLADCNLSPSSGASHDEELGKRLWELSENMVSTS